MPDISMCKGPEWCLCKDSCYRFKATPDPDWQTWIDWDQMDVTPSGDFPEFVEGMLCAATDQSPHDTCPYGYTDAIRHGTWWHGWSRGRMDRNRADGKCWMYWDLKEEESDEPASPDQIRELVEGVRTMRNLMLSRFPRPEENHG